MMEANWPTFTRPSRLRILITQSVRGIFSLGFWKMLLAYAAVCAVYKLYAMHATLPGANQAMAADIVGHWWLLEFVDLFFTGGAFGNASFFAPGIVYLVPMSIIYFSTKTKPSKVYPAKERACVLVISGLFTAWYVQQGVIAPSVLPIAISVAGMLLAAGVIRWLELTLSDHRLPNLSSTFVVFVVVDFSSACVSHNDYDRLAAVAVFMLVLFSIYLYFNQRKETLPVRSLEEHYACLSKLQLPVFNTRLISIIIAMGILFAVLTNAAASVFFPALSPNVSWLTPVVLVLLWMYVGSFLIACDLLPFYTGFDPFAMARSLREHYFMVESCPPGPETEALLRSRLKTMIHRGKIVSMLLLVLFCLFNWLFNSLPGSTSFPAGLYGILLASSSLMHFGMAFIRIGLWQGNKRLSSYSWSYGGVANMNVDFYAALSKQDIAEKDANLLLSLFDPETRNKIMELMAAHKRPSIQFVIQFFRILQQSPFDKRKRHDSVPHIIFGSFIFCAILFSLYIILKKFILPTVNPVLIEFMNEFIVFCGLFISISLFFLRALKPDFIRRLSKKKELLSTDNSSDDNRPTRKRQYDIDG